MNWGNIQMPSNQEIVECARSWLGTPWRHQGRTKRGIDCIGLIIVVAHEMGLSDFDVTDYGRQAHGYKFEEGFELHMDRKPIPAAVPGNALILRDSRFPCHCGIVSSISGVPHLIHAHAAHRKVIEEPFQEHILNNRRGCFAFRGVTE